MKNPIFLVIVFAIASMLSAWGQRAPDPPQLSVTGSAELKVQPDEAALYVSVESRDKDLIVAKKENDERVSHALGFLEGSGVAKEDVQTDYLEVKPVFVTHPPIDPNTGLPLRDFDQERAYVEPAYYVVRKSIRIKLTNLERFDVVLSGLILSGVNQVQSLEFRSSKRRDLEDQARVLAVRDAKRKAESMASELGIKLGQPYRVNANEIYDSPSRSIGGGGGGGGFMNAQATSDDVSTTFSSGQITISATVHVTYAIE